MGAHKFCLCFETTPIERLEITFVGSFCILRFIYAQQQFHGFHVVSLANASWREKKSVISTCANDTQPLAKSINPFHWSNQFD